MSMDQRLLWGSYHCGCKREPGPIQWVFRGGGGVYLIRTAGILAADESNGRPLEFSFGRNALYPDFVGDLITVEEYEALLPQLFALASHCGPGFQNWQGEAFDPPEAFTHGFRLDSAALQGEALILRGQLIQGAPGELEATEVAVAQLTLTREQGGAGNLRP